MANAKFSNVVLFANESRDLYDAMNAYKEECIKERKGIASFSNGRTKTAMEELIDKQYRIELFTKAAKFGIEAPKDGSDTEFKRFSNKGVVREFADEIQNNVIDMILPDVIMQGSLPYIADIRTAELDDSIKFNIENNSYFTVSKAGNRKRETNFQKLEDTTFVMRGENHEVSVFATLFELLTGRVSFAKNMMKVAMSIEAQMFNEAYSAFRTEALTLTGNLQTTNITSQAVMALAQTVTAYNQRRQAVILGTPVALTKVVPSNANYRYDFNSDFVKTGYLQLFNGFELVPMQQYADYTSTNYGLALKDSEIFIVSPSSDKIVKIGLFGGVMTHTDQPYDNANKTVGTTIEKSWGVSVVTGSTMGVITAVN